MLCTHDPWQAKEKIMAHDCSMLNLQCHNNRCNKHFQLEKEDGDVQSMSEEREQPSDKKRNLRCCLGNKAVMKAS